MASVWIRCSEGEWYVKCSNLAEAYSLGCSLSINPPSFYTICNQYSTQSIHELSVHPVYVSIYDGIYSPPVKKEWFPNGIFKMELVDVLKNPLYLEKKQKIKEIKEIKQFEKEIKKYMQQLKLYKS